MIETSELYKQLFNDGAIQEYYVDIDGELYYQSDMYDTPTVSQVLFDKPTLTVGSFAASVFKIKLRIASIDIQRNANVKFYYRYTDGIENSEWIKKFDGKVTGREKFNDDVTSIVAMDRAANTDVFLDYFNESISSYPANTRVVANLCATHLGVDIENIEDIYDANIVEYPNEMTIISVLKNIAALSGGNFTITEDDKLKLIVTRNVIGELNEYASMGEPIGSSLLNPISHIEMYYDDVSGFQAGDSEVGSTLIIDTVWATQGSTDYVFSVLNGYKYIPMKASGVYGDPATQLGDTIQYELGTPQLVANVTWTFDGAVTADIDAPQNNDIAFDDPYDILVANEFKRKVSLGDNYQGVTIDRQNGINMVFSPDGTLENAIARFYANLEKGMAFQTRDNASEEWFDWLYFDIPEKTFKLSLYNTSQEVDAKIQLNNTYVHNGNILPNLNGESGYFGWTGNSDLLYVKEVREGIEQDLGFTEYMTYGHGFVPKQFDNSLSNWGLSFFNNGSDISPRGRIIPNVPYSFRTKVIRFKPFTVNLLEYKSMLDLLPFTTQTFIFDTEAEYLEFTTELDTQTTHAALEFVRSGISPNDRLEITENMFNRGEPKQWFQNAEDVRIWAEAQIQVLNNEITLNASQIDAVSGAIHNAGVEINAIEGVTTRGKKFRVLSEDGNTTYLEVDENGLKVINAIISGNLTAGTIAGLQFEGSKIVFPDGKLALNSATNSIDFGDLELKFEQGFSEISGDYGIAKFKSTSNPNAVLELFMDDGLGQVYSDRVATNSIMPKTSANMLIGADTWEGTIKIVSRSIEPINTNSIDLGTSSLRFKTLFLQNQPNVSSDTRHKLNVQDIDPLLIEIIGREIKPKQYHSKHDDKIHFGYIAQDVERALYKYCGHDKDKYAMLHKDESYMSLLYGELNVIIEAYNRQENEKLQTRIELLEERMNKL